MNAQKVDDRNDEQKKTHTLAIVARDNFMSGWGEARGGDSRCAWAFDPSKVNSDRVYNWVKARPEMRFVSLVEINKYRVPRGTAQLHIYLCDENHVAAKY